MQRFLHSAEGGGRGQESKRPTDDQRIKQRESVTGWLDEKDNYLSGVLGARNILVSFCVGLGRHARGYAQHIYTMNRYGVPGPSVLRRRGGGATRSSAQQGLQEAIKGGQRGGTEEKADTSMCQACARRARRGWAGCRRRLSGDARASPRRESARSRRAQ